MDPVPTSSGEGEEVTCWQCQSSSIAWVLLPQSVIAILDATENDNALEKCVVKLSQESLSLIHAASSAQDWWPDFDDQDEKKGASGAPNAKPAKKLAGLFLIRQGRSRAKAKAKAKSKAKEVVKKLKEKVLPKKVKLKKAAKASHCEDIPEIEKNFTRTAKGAALIRQMLNKCKKLDASKFPGHGCADFAMVHPFYSDLLTAG